MEASHNCITSCIIWLDWPQNGVKSCLLHYVGLCRYKKLDNLSEYIKPFSKTPNFKRRAHWIAAYKHLGTVIINRIYMYMNLSSLQKPSWAGRRRVHLPLIPKISTGKNEGRWGHSLLSLWKNWHVLKDVLEWRRHCIWYPMLIMRRICYPHLKATEACLQCH